LVFVWEKTLRKPLKFGRKKLGAADKYVCECLRVCVCTCGLAVCVLRARTQAKSIG